MITHKHPYRAKITGALAAAVVVGSSFAPVFAATPDAPGSETAAMTASTAMPSLVSAAATAAETPQNDPGAERNATNTTGVMGGFAFSEPDENGIVRFNHNGIWGGSSVEGQRVVDDHWKLNSPNFQLEFANPITALTIQNAYQQIPAAVPLEVGTQITIQNYFWDEEFGPGIAPDSFTATISGIEITKTGGTLVSFETLTPGYMPGAVAGNITEAVVDDEVPPTPVITPTGEALDDNYTTDQGVAVKFDLAANDTTTDGFHAEQFKFHIPGTVFAATRWTDDHGNVWAVDSGTGKGTMTPAPGFTGDASASYSWALKSSDPEAGPNSYGLFGADVNVKVAQNPAVEVPPTPTPTPSEPPVVVPTPTPSEPPVVVPTPTPSDPPVVAPPTEEPPVVVPPTDTPPVVDVPEEPVVPVDVPEEPVMAPEIPVVDDGGEGAEPPVIEDDLTDGGTPVEAELADTGARAGGLMAGALALLVGAAGLLGITRKKAKAVKVDA